ncbi:MAG TPA: hypothetical protein VF139_09860 [Candidatus Polarisedimenticolaceae bacterium]
MPITTLLLAGALEALVSDLESRSPTLAALASTARALPNARLEYAMAPPRPGRRAHANLRIFRPAHPSRAFCDAALDARIVLPPARTADEQAALLAHELSHLLDVYAGLPPDDGASEARAQAVERRVRAEARGARAAAPDELTTRLARAGSCIPAPRR